MRYIDKQVRSFIRKLSLAFNWFLPDPDEEYCEICGEPGASARDEDSDIWCWACFAEQRPEDAY